MNNVLNGHLKIWYLNNNEAWQFPKAEVHPDVGRLIPFLGIDHNILTYPQHFISPQWLLCLSNISSNCSSCLNFYIWWSPPIKDKTQGINYLSLLFWLTIQRPQLQLLPWPLTETVLGHLKFNYCTRAVNGQLVCQFFWLFVFNLKYLLCFFYPWSPFRRRG